MYIRDVKKEFYERIQSEVRQISLLFSYHLIHNWSKYLTTGTDSDSVSDQCQWQVGR